MKSRFQSLFITPLIVAALSLTSLTSFVPDADAKGSTSSGSRSSKPSAPASNSGKSSFWGSSKPSAPATAPAPPTATNTNSYKPSAADNALANKSKITNTPKVTRQQAIDKFKAENATKYTNKFTSEPTTRPSYIPQRTRGSDGVEYNITYNSGFGGYGYMNALGTFILYDALTDAAMASARHYPVSYPAGTTVVHHSSGAATFVVVTLSLLAIVAVAFFFIRRAGRAL